MFRLIPHRALIEPHARIESERSECDMGITATMRIDGLLCSACAANVKQRLERIEGVRSAHVDLDGGAARVTYEATRTSAEELVAAVEGTVILRPLRRALARLGRPLATRAAH